MDSKIKEISNLFDSLLDDFTYDALKSEQEFRNIMDCIFKIAFNEVGFEVHTKNGRSDTVIIVKSRTFIIEYKVDNENKIEKKGKNEPSNKAIEQIKKKKYYAKYSKTNTPVLLFGITLNPQLGPHLRNSNNIVEVCSIISEKNNLRGMVDKNKSLSRFIRLCSK
jgi:hypothetical protein